LFISIVSIIGLFITYQEGKRIIRSIGKNFLDLRQTFYFPPNKWKNI
jgi:hypothetical protein